MAQRMEIADLDPKEMGSRATVTANAWWEIAPSSGEDAPGMVRCWIEGYESNVVTLANYTQPNVPAVYTGDIQLPSATQVTVVVQPLNGVGQAWLSGSLDVNVEYEDTVKRTFDTPSTERP
jgi:hypothetical protein